MRDMSILNFVMEMIQIADQRLGERSFECLERNP